MEAVMAEKHKILVAYYSLDGNSKFVAEEFAKRTGADIERIRAGKQPPKKGFGKYYFGALDALLHADPHLAETQKDPADYDTLILVGPVWAGTYAPALGAFIDENIIVGKEIYLVACSESGKGDGALKGLTEKLEGNRIISTLNLKSPLKNYEETQHEIEEFTIMIG